TQEALTNVQRHAEATAASVLLTLGPGLASVNVRVKDNGRGMAEDAISNGFGLRGMQERIAQLGGTVDIESTRTTGTSVSVTLPIGDSRDPA
ncbi:MAG: ATP-binding protein, partial [Chloroflexi bacterium]|nr:ATP-binding protein [Chloroflexota bacterium]